MQPDQSGIQKSSYKRRHVAFVYHSAMAHIDDSTTHLKHSSNALLIVPVLRCSALRPFKENSKNWSLRCAV